MNTYLFIIDGLISLLITILFLPFLDSLFDDKKLSGVKEISREVWLVIAGFWILIILLSISLAFFFLFSLLPKSFLPLFSVLVALLFSTGFVWFFVWVVYPAKNTFEIDHEHTWGVLIKHIKSFDASLLKKKTLVVIKNTISGADYFNINRGDVGMLKKEINAILQSGEAKNVAVMEQKIGFLLDHFDNPLEAKNVFEQYKSKKKTMRASERIVSLEEVLKKVVSFIETRTEFTKAAQELAYSEEITKRKKEIEIGRLKIEQTKLEMEEKTVRARGETDIVEQEKRKEGLEKRPALKKSKEEMRREEEKRKEYEIGKIRSEEERLRASGLSEDDIAYKLEEYKRYMGYGF